MNRNGRPARTWRERWLLPQMRVTEQDLRVRPLALLLTAAVLAVPGPTWAKPPTSIPEFHAESGDEEVLTRSRVRGKVLLVWYEADGLQEVNAKLKEELKTFNTTQLARPFRLMVLPFADVSGLIWPATAIGRSKLRDVSKEIGLTVWGDWDGSVREGFQFTEDQASVLIADDRGVIRWRHTGRVPAERFAEIKALIKALVDGDPAGSVEKAR